MDKETGMYYYGARYYDPRISIFVSVDPLAEEFPNYGGYVYTMNNPINLVDPTGMAPEENDDWIKNKKTGEVKWFDGNRKEAESKARLYWRESLYEEEPIEIENLGSSFFGTKGKNLLDYKQIKSQQEKYLFEVSEKIGEKAGVQKLDFGISANTYTFAYLKDMFMGDGGSSKKAGFKIDDDLLSVAWDLGGGDILQKRTPKTVLSRVIFRGADLYFSSQDLGVGSDKRTFYQDAAKSQFNNRVKNTITNEVLMKIRLHLY